MAYSAAACRLPRAESLLRYGPWHHSIIGGGGYNTNSGYAATIVGGLLNTSSGYVGTVPGGKLNAATFALTVSGTAWFDTGNLNWAP